MGRKFAFITFLCLSAMIVMGLLAPDDPLFLFAAKGPVPLAIRTVAALAMLALTFGTYIRSDKSRSYLGLSGFGLMVLGILILGATNGGGIYPYLQPADLLSLLVIGITCSTVALEAMPATTAVTPQRSFSYQEFEDESENRKHIKAAARRKPRTA
jgi:hypothetical protein